MKSAGAIQVVVVLLLVASAASCEVAKEYSTRVFKPATPKIKSDSAAIALKFMQFDSENPSDSINLKDIATTDFEVTGKAELAKDSLKTTEIPVVENKEVLKRHPGDESKRGTTRNKRVRQ